MALRNGCLILVVLSFSPITTLAQTATPTPTMLPGDYDRNGYVAPPDLWILEPQWYHGERGGGQTEALTPTPTQMQPDGNKDGLVGPEDLIILKSNWHKGTEPSPFEIITINIPGLPEGAKPLRMVRIPQGSYQMGAPDTERGYYAWEGPVHTVNIEYDFYMSEVEVSQAQYHALMGSNPASGAGVGDDYPVYSVSWDQITQVDGLLDRLNALGEGTFRLPSESEWEYACRGGTQTRFNYGDSLECGDGGKCEDCAAGTMTGNRSDFMWYCWSEGLNGYATGAKPGGSLQPNGFGLYDMHGNLFEWCQDWYHDSYTGAPTNGSAWETPAGYYRIVRGGARNSYPSQCRSAFRYWQPSSTTSLAIGIRLVFAPTSVEPTPALTATATPTRTLDILSIPIPGLPVGAKPLRMVRIPSGSCKIGNPGTGRDTAYQYLYELPVHEVTIAYDFYMGETEVTQAQWQALMGSNPAVNNGVGDDYPVYLVSWNDITQANGFLDRLNALGQGVFRLPSEAEWEYACRGPAENPNRYSPFYFGDDTAVLMIDCTTSTLFSDNMQWCGNNSPATTKPVAGKLPNPYGLHDMSGNVWEWCQDWYHSNYYGAPNNGSAWEDPVTSDRVIRGGGHDSPPWYLRSAYRDRNIPTFSHKSFGLRVVRNVSR